MDWSAAKGKRKFTPEQVATIEVLLKSQDLEQHRIGKDGPDVIVHRVLPGGRYEMYRVPPSGELRRV